MAKSQKPGSASRFPVVQLVPNESEENVRLVRDALRPVRLIDGQATDTNSETTTQNTQQQ
jgi:hypothetical protein